jgi:hypothetical protein
MVFLAWKTSGLAAGSSFLRNLTKKKIQRLSSQSRLLPKRFSSIYGTMHSNLTETLISIFNKDEEPTLEKLIENFETKEFEIFVDPQISELQKKTSPGDSPQNAATKEQ